MLWLGVVIYLYKVDSNMNIFKCQKTWIGHSNIINQYIKRTGIRNPIIIIFSNPSDVPTRTKVRANVTCFYFSLLNFFLNFHIELSKRSNTISQHYICCTNKITELVYIFKKKNASLSRQSVVKHINYIQNQQKTINKPWIYRKMVMVTIKLY